MISKRFARFAWGILALNIFVIVWGVLVRATGSGAGCGNHWPTCNGTVLPSLAQHETFIEFFHRLTTGIDLPLVLLLLFWSYRLYPSGHQVRIGAQFSTIFLVVEALIGAVLVRFDLVVDNDSVARAFVVAAHLVNTFLLVGSLTLTAWWASGGAPVRLGRASNSAAWALGAALIGTILLGANGAVTALGDTLSLAAGIHPEDSPLVAWLIEMRVVHPLMALGVGGLIGLAFRLARRERATPALRRTGYALMGAYALQLGLGALNVALQAPVWLQLVHLLVADVIWILLILLAAQWLAVPAALSAGATVGKAVAQAGD